ncbi:hypothetical protein B1B_01339 [mine drainage metagenome]|uniref:CRISPR-associated protein Cas6 C-terminal domain-containing protein n=1 Tax=mine drainage metagenome TaxID=410659 RepID=T1D683_9ZZZZ
MRRYEHVPHPFTLRFEQAEEVTRGHLILTLFGHGTRQLPIFLYAFEQAVCGERGIAGNHMTLDGVDQVMPEGPVRIYTPGGSLKPLPLHVPTMPSVPMNVRLVLQTPMRLKREGHRVGVTDFRFADLFGNLLRRISMLTYFHTDTPLETDFRALMDAASAVEIQAQLSWREQPRYSRRQGTEMSLGGVVGELEVRDTDLSPFWPYLWLGQWTHAGTAASMGLGHYWIASLPMATPDTAMPIISS